MMIYHVRGINNLRHTVIGNNKEEALNNLITVGAATVSRFLVYLKDENFFCRICNEKIINDNDMEEDLNFIFSGQKIQHMAIDRHVTSKQHTTKQIYDVVKNKIEIREATQEEDNINKIEYLIQASKKSIERLNKDMSIFDSTINNVKKMREKTAKKINIHEYMIKKNERKLKDLKK